MTIVESKKVALLCAERFSWKCHRRLIGSFLQKEGFQVIHIIEKDKLWESKKNDSM